MVGPSLQHVEARRIFRYKSSFVIPRGLTLRTRFGWRPDGAYDIRAELVDSGGNRSNVIGQLDSASRPIVLSPGENTLIVSQQNDDEVLHVLQWYDEYLVS